MLTVGLGSRLLVLLRLMSWRPAVVRSRASTINPHQPPTTSGNFTLLQTTFFLSSNYLSAWIPTELGNFKSMKANFTLDNNAGICDYIPTQVAALSGSISGWDITTGNSLGTPCCELLSDFNCLPITDLSTAATTALDFSTGQYTGTIRTEAGRLTALTSPSLESNTLTGPVPSELGNLVAMKVEFQLYSNRLSSSLPTQLGRMTALTTLFELHENSLSASLPSELGALTSLASWLRLDLNSITAEVPTELGSRTQLTAALFLESNQLCGWDAIPTEVAALTASVTSNWEVSDGNDGIGTPCCETLSGYNCLPVGLPTSATTYIDLNERNHTGTIRAKPYRHNTNRVWAADFDHRVERGEELSNREHSFRDRHAQRVGRSSPSRLQHARRSRSNGARSVDCAGSFAEAEGKLVHWNDRYRARQHGRNHEIVLRVGYELANWSSPKRTR